MRWLKYPYTNFHELNLDWLVENMEKIDLIFDEIKAKLVELEDELGIQTGRIDTCLDAINYIQAHYRQMMASEYDETRQYDPGEIIRYDDEIYICLPGQTPGPWNGNYWRQTTLGDELGPVIYKIEQIIIPDLTNINNLLADMIPVLDKIINEYDPNETYNYPDYVTYEGNIYCCNDSNVTGAWDSTKWNSVTTLALDLAYKIRTLFDWYRQIFNWVDTYDDTAVYNTGDVVNFNSVLYECLNDNVTGPWDSTKWAAQKITDAMADINKQTYKDFAGTLVAGNTTVGILDSFITADSLIDVYVDTYGINPMSVTASVGDVTVIFPAQGQDLNYVIRVSHVKN